MPGMDTIFRIWDAGMPTVTGNFCKQKNDQKEDSNNGIEVV